MIIYVGVKVSRESLATHLVAVYGPKQGTPEGYKSLCNRHVFHLGARYTGREWLFDEIPFSVCVWCKRAARRLEGKPGKDPLPKSHRRYV